MSWLTFFRAGRHLDSHVSSTIVYRHAAREFAATLAGAQWRWKA